MFRPNKDRLTRNSNFTPFGSLQDEEEYYGVDEKRRDSLGGSWTNIQLPTPFGNSRRKSRGGLTYHSSVGSSFTPLGLVRYVVRRPTQALKILVSLGITIFLIVLYIKKVALKRPNTFVFHEEDVRRVWEWEIQSGHYMSWRPIKVWHHPPHNPSLQTPMTAEDVEEGEGIIGCGWARKYIHPDDLRDRALAKRLGVDPASLTSEQKKANKIPHAFPPRPLPGSIADLDLVWQRCDFDTKRYVRDCLEYLRVGAGLDNLTPHARPPAIGSKEDELPNAAGPGKVDFKPNRRDKGKPLPVPADWRYMYMEDRTSIQAPPTDWSRNYIGGRGLEAPLSLPVPKLPGGGVPAYTLGSGTTVVDPPSEPDQQEQKPKWSPGACVEDYPRIFHMYWKGDFTDKPYMSLLSFLYSQNLGLDGPQHHPLEGEPFCRAEFWVWINPHQEHENPEEAHKEVFDKLGSNPWSAPFLHSRFEEVIKFKVWNTTEQLDATPELAKEWRSLVGNDASSLRSDGKVVKKKDGAADHPAAHPPPPQPPVPNAEGDETDETKEKKQEEEERQVVDPKRYDTPSVVMSDTARWLLLHRYGGVYLDADTLLLRDWEELWGYRGAFAYRWSRLPDFNTAILKMNKGSALGTFLLRTAARNGLDLHPMTVWRYIQEAGLEWLLFRLPDALFDSAWLNIEDFQRDRPPTPDFAKFEDFLETPKYHAALPTALGFPGFFRGAYAYHWHNQWWTPFDLIRNYPDLGPRFAEGERTVKEQIAKAAASAAAKSGKSNPASVVSGDARDLSWGTVLKRTFEAYLRQETPNMYGEWIEWS